jgi:glycosyltransferase involved in cell wall biosynthesis
MNPKVSVIIPCYNHGKFVRDALQSVLKSTVIDVCEIIIVNDGSTEPFTIQVMLELEQEGYKVINQQNQGLGKTRNNGIQLAKGKYILPLDADNTISPDFIEKAVSVLDTDRSKSIVYTDREFFGQKQGIDHVGSFDIKRMIYMNYIDACAIYRKEVWEIVGGYDEKMPVQGWEDWDFWLMAAEKDYRFHYVPEVLFQYRILEDSMIKQLVLDKRFPDLIDYINKKHTSFLYDSFREIYQQYMISRFENQHPLRTSIKYLYRWLSNKS